jgi:hypothetical protein
MRRSHLTKAEWQIILEAVNAYEAEPANFEDDLNEKRYEALISARGKIEDRL